MKQLLKWSSGGGTKRICQNKYGGFDGLRAFAAIGIAMMHYLANIDENISEKLKNSGILYSEIVPFFTSFVFMFFTLSAFSMCCGYLHKFDTTDGKSSFCTESFYNKRYSRIWPFFSLLVLIDFIMNPSKEELYQCIADLTLAFNLLPNPEIHVIGVGWFLGVIFLFYMIFPWFAYLLQDTKRAWLAMGVSLIMHFLVVDYYLTEEFVLPSEISNFRHNIVWSFPFLMIGGLLFLYRGQLGRKEYRWLWIIIALSGFIVQFKYHPVICGDNYMYMMLLFTVCICYTMTGGIKIFGIYLLDNKLMKFIGGLSMEIYLCHMVMFRVIEKVHLENYILNPHIYFWVICSAGLLMAILFSWSVKNIMFPYISGKIVLVRKKLQKI